MKQYLCLILIIIFSLLSILHFYWALGGHWALNNTIPKDVSGNTLLNPSPLTTVSIGIILGSMAAYYAVLSKLITMELPTLILSICGYLIALIFILRAIGDFKYVGFFKNINETEFARMDTLIYSPLCLVIGVIGIIVLNMK